MNYMIFYRRGAGTWGKLTPFVHEKLYKRAEIEAAVAFLRANEKAEGVALRLEDEQYNVVRTLSPGENIFG